MKWSMKWDDWNWWWWRWPKRRRKWEMSGRESGNYLSDCWWYSHSEVIRIPVLRYSICCSSTTIALIDQCHYYSVIILQRSTFCIVIVFIVLLFIRYRIMTVMMFIDIWCYDVESYCGRKYITCDDAWDSVAVVDDGIVDEEVILLWRNWIFIVVVFIFWLSWGGCVEDLVLVCDCPERPWWPPIVWPLLKREGPFILMTIPLWWYLVTPLWPTVMTFCDPLFIVIIVWPHSGEYHSFCILVVVLLIPIYSVLDWYRGNCVLEYSDVVSCLFILLFWCHILQKYCSLCPSIVTVILFLLLYSQWKPSAILGDDGEMILVCC